MVNTLPCFNNCDPKLTPLFSLSLIHRVTTTVGKEKVVLEKMKEEKSRDVGDVERLDAPNTRQRRGVGRKFWGAVFISLLLLHVFLRPVSYGMSGCMTGSSSEKNIERRVKYILKHTPLIGKTTDQQQLLPQRRNKY